MYAVGGAPPPSTTPSLTTEHAITDNILASIAHFITTDTYIDVLGSVTARQSQRKNGMSVNPPTYDQVSRGTRLMQAISDKTADLHRLVIDLYTPKFPDLHTLVTNLEMYFRVVQRIGNSTDVASCGVEDLLPKTDAIRVVVSGSTSNDSPLSIAVLSRLMSACKSALDLFNARNLISDMVMAGMQNIAPNVTAMVSIQSDAVSKCSL